MSKKHLKRFAAPKTWHINRKNNKFVTKPVPGPHSLELGIPINILLKEALGYANTPREAKKIINIHEIKIDGVARKNLKFPVGVFDTIEVINTNQRFRVILDRNGNIKLTEINKDEISFKPCKIIGKTLVRGKLQLNLYDGNNILADNNSYKVGDTLLLSLPQKRIIKHLRLDKKSTIFLIGGKHIGETGNVEDITGNKVVYKDQKGDLIETSKRYAFVIGDAKPLITIK